MAPLLLTQKSPSSEIPNIPTIPCPGMASVSRVFTEVQPRRMPALPGHGIERCITQLRGNSVNGFRVSSTRIEDTENALSAKPSRFPLMRPIPANPSNLSFVRGDKTVRSVKKCQAPARRGTANHSPHISEAG